MQQQKTHLISDELTTLTGGSEFFPAGRAATALYWAYLTIIKSNGNIPDPEIILPGLSCGTPSNAAIMAGLTPRYADVSRETGLLSLDTIKSVYTDRTLAVVCIHLYGETMALDEIRKWCDEKNVALIEDLAHAVGGLLPGGKAAGSYGDYCIYSFNKTKILESGGGALLVKSRKNAALAGEIIASEKINEADPALLGQLSASYRNLHHSLVALQRNELLPDASAVFLAVRKSYEPLFLRNYHGNEELLEEEWTNLGANLAGRMKKARIYKTLLKREDVHLLDGWESSGVCWRFSFLLPDPALTVPVCEAVRKDGYHVSNLYWPVNLFFRPADECPGALHIAKSIVNLWVDKNISEKDVEGCGLSLIRHLHKRQN